MSNTPKHSFTTTPNIATAIRDAYAAGDTEHVKQLLVSAVDGSIDQLVDAIEIDARCRIDFGLDVTLDWYTSTIPNIKDIPAALDTAIDVTLRRDSGDENRLVAAADELSNRYPEFREQISLATCLTECFWSTERVKKSTDRLAHFVLPMQVGDRYQLIRAIGEGSSGRVFLAHDKQLSSPENDAKVAIKIFAPTATATTDGERFIEEAVRARSVIHDSVARILDRGVTIEGYYYLVMEFVEGGSLDNALKASTLDRSPRAIAELIAQVADGLHAVHSAGLLHRDLKPANILLSSEQNIRPKLIDFSAALRMDTPMSIISQPARDNYIQAGNLAFAAPECIADHTASSVSSDLYSLAALTHYLLTGELTIRPGLPEGIPVSNTTGQRIPPFLASIINRSLSLDPLSRHDSSAEFAFDLRNWITRKPVHWMNIGLHNRLLLWTCRAPWQASAVLLAVTATIAFTAAWVSGTDKRAFDRARVEYRKMLVPVIDYSHPDPDEPTHLRDWLMANAVAEQFGGIAAFGDIVHGTRDNSVRILMFRDEITRLESIGATDTFETNFWRAGLALLILAQREDLEEANALLDRSDTFFHAALARDDPFLTKLDLLQAIAKIQTYTRSSNPTGDPDPAAIATLEQQVTDSLGSPPTDPTRQHLRDPLLSLAVRHLAELDRNGTSIDPGVARAVRKAMDRK